MLLCAATHCGCVRVACYTVYEHQPGIHRCTDMLLCAATHCDCGTHLAGQQASRPSVSFGKGCRADTSPAPVTGGVAANWAPPHATVVAAAF